MLLLSLPLSFDPSPLSHAIPLASIPVMPLVLLFSSCYTSQSVRRELVKEAAADHETPVVELDQQSALRQDANATATANANAHLLSKLQAAAAQDTNARRLLANLLTRAQAVTSSSAAAASSSSFSSQTSFGDLRTSQFLASLEEPDLQAQLPAFVKPLPARIASEDVKYLHTKGALSLPPLPLQTALLQAYVEYVHPYMPLLDLREFLGAVNARDGLCGQVSLFLYQAIMFAATAFVDMKALKEAGYSTRKAARRSFFSKTRVCPRLPHSLPPAPPLPPLLRG